MFAIAGGILIAIGIIWLAWEGIVIMLDGEGGAGCGCAMLAAALALAAWVIL